MQYHYTCKAFESGEVQMKFIRVEDMSALISWIENKLAELKCSLYLIDSDKQSYKDEYQLSMNTTIGSAVVEISLIDETLIITAPSEQIKMYDKLFKQNNI